MCTNKVMNVLVRKSFCQNPTRALLPQMRDWNNIRDNNCFNFSIVALSVSFSKNYTLI